MIFTRAYVSWYPKTHSIKPIMNSLANIHLCNQTTRWWNFEICIKWLRIIMFNECTPQVLIMTWNGLPSKKLDADCSKSVIRWGTFPQCYGGSVAFSTEAAMTVEKGWMTLMFNKIALALKGWTKSLPQGKTISIIFIALVLMEKENWKKCFY